MPYSDVISELKEAKNAFGLTNRDIADGSGVPIGTVSRVFSNPNGDYRYETLEPIIRYLGRLDVNPNAPGLEEPVDRAAEIALYERMLELANQRHAEELAEVRKAHADRLEEQRAIYEDRLEKVRESEGKRVREYKHWVTILAIACCILIVFIMGILVIDILNPTVGWVQAIAAWTKDAAQHLLPFGRL